MLEGVSNSGRKRKTNKVVDSQSVDEYYKTSYSVM